MKGGRFVDWATQGPWRGAQPSPFEVFADNMAVDVETLSGLTVTNPISIPLIELLRDRDFLNYLFTNDVENAANKAKRQRLDDRLMNLFFGVDKNWNIGDQVPDPHPRDTDPAGVENNIVSLLERIIWYLWTIEDDNSLYKLIPRELRGRPRDELVKESETCPASFKILYHMAHQKTINPAECPPRDPPWPEGVRPGWLPPPDRGHRVDCRECEGGAAPDICDGYWRGMNAAWMDGEQKYLHFSDRPFSQFAITGDEERVIYERSFMSWTSSKLKAVEFAMRGIPNKRGYSVLFRLVGGISVDQEYRINYEDIVHTTLGRLRYFSDLGEAEQEFLLNPGFLIFKASLPDRGGEGQINRYEEGPALSTGVRLILYRVYFLPLDDLHNYVIAKVMNEIGDELWSLIHIPAYSAIIGDIIEDITGQLMTESISGHDLTHPTAEVRHRWGRVKSRFSQRASHRGTFV